LGSKQDSNISKFDTKTELKNQDGLELNKTLNKVKTEDKESKKESKNNLEDRDRLEEKSETKPNLFFEEISEKAVVLK
jgi:hypothetical protein